MVEHDPASVPRPIAWGTFTRHSLIKEMPFSQPQGVPLEDVRCLAGHAEPRATGLYDRQQQRISI
jgi:hypothetical protein